MIRAAYRFLVLLALLAALPPFVSAQEEGPQHGLLPEESVAWTYEAADGTRFTVTLGDEEEMSVFGRQSIVARPVLGLRGDLWVRATEETLTIYERRAIGYAGTPEVVIAAEVCLDRPTWSFQTANGCILSTTEGRLLDPETITVPAGTFRCAVAHLDGGFEELTLWLAPGVGAVRFTVDRGDGPTTWNLVTVEPR